MTNDPINPNHYKNGQYETIDIIADKLTPEAYKGYLNGNIYKYISRWEHKNGVEDLRKAEWHLGKLIEFVKEE